MRVGILTTNGGPHPPQTWARETAAMLVDIIQIDPGLSAEKQAAAQLAKDELEIAFRKALAPHLAAVQEDERAKLDEHGEDRLLDELDAGGHVDSSFDDVIAVVKRSLFAAHYAKPEVRQFVASTLDKHYRGVMDVERSWRADSNPESKTVEAYREARAVHGPDHVHATHRLLRPDRTKKRAKRGK